jgi:hypothetical protein
MNMSKPSSRWADEFRVPLEWLRRFHRREKGTRMAPIRPSRRAFSRISIQQEGPLMPSENKTRFRSAEEALRFYFRLRALLHSGRTSRLIANELPASVCAGAVTAIDDYQCIGGCMHGLDELALWLLGEVYGPTCFGVHRRTISHACKAARLEFPRRDFRLREVGTLHDHALGVVRRRLQMMHMIPARQLERLHDGRSHRQAGSKRLRYHRSQVASRG